MRILCYTSIGNESGDRLMKMLDEVLPIGRVEALRQVNGFIQRLRMPSSDLEMLIFMPANRHELFAVSSLLTEMRDVRLVLVLPDRESETIAMAHSLRPRFLTYSNGDYSELKEVLKKMLKDSSKSESDAHRR